MRYEVGTENNKVIFEIDENNEVRIFRDLSNLTKQELINLKESEQMKHNAKITLFQQVAKDTRNQIDKIGTWTMENRTTEVVINIKDSEILMEFGFDKWNECFEVAFENTEGQIDKQLEEDIKDIVCREVDRHYKEQINGNSYADGIYEDYRV